MKIQKATLSLFNLIGFVLLLGTTTTASARQHHNSIVAFPPEKNMYVDNSLKAFPASAVNNPGVLQLFSHGRSGELLLDGKWRNATEIVAFIQSRHLINAATQQINIYGCEFGKGTRGALALQYIQQALHINAAASNNITGKDGDWTLEMGKASGVLSFPEYSGNLQYAPGDDLDGDGIANASDIDDDNDGILDAIEAPSCYYTATDIIRPMLVTTELVTANTTTNGISKTYDNDPSSYSYFNTNQAITGVTLYEITPIAPVAISSMNFVVTNNWYMTSNATSTVMLQGFNGTSWDTLSTIAPHNTFPVGAVADTFKNTLHPTTIYSKYRVRGVAGTAYYSGVNEITLTPLAPYTPSLYPKPTCLVDTDNDGITNDKDLDSDGDGCPDAVEGNIYNQAGVTASSGSVKNGSGGAVTSTTTVANAVINGPYGGNGFADILQSTADTNKGKYSNIPYLQYAISKPLNRLYQCTFCITYRWCC